MDILLVFYSMSKFKTNGLLFVPITDYMIMHYIYTDKSDIKFTRIIFYTYISIHKNVMKKILH